MEETKPQLVRVHTQIPKEHRNWVRREAAKLTEETGDRVSEASLYRKIISCHIETCEKVKLGRFPKHEKKT